MRDRAIAGMEQAAPCALAGETPASQAKQAARHGLRLLSVYGLILAVDVDAAAVAAILWVLRRCGNRRDRVAIGSTGWKAMGFRTANFWRSLWIVGAALALAGVAMLVAARMRTLRLPAAPLAFI